MTILDSLHDQLGDDLFEATETLSEFIERAAVQRAEQVGFGFVLVHEAPNTFPTLSSAYANSIATGAPLPISSENSADAIYPSASVNGALRSWHDVNHVRRHLGFGLVNELELSLWHLGELEKTMHPPGSLVWRLLHADLTGQAYVQAFESRFPFDLRRIVSGCVTAGFDHGLLAELRAREGT